MHITSTQEATAHGIKMLVYGQSGVGKTRLAMTCPERPLILSAEAGLLSLRGADIPVATINSISDLREAYLYVRDSDEYSWIILDSISEIAEQVLAYEKAQTKDPRKAYGELAEQVTALVKGFRDLPGKNVVMVAKAERQKDELTGAVLVSPSLPGTKLGQGLPYLFDEVLYMRSDRNAEGEITRFLQTFPDFQATAKDRSGALAPYEVPDLAVIAEKIAE